MSEKLIHKSCEEFSQVLASRAAVPGGGGVSALVGAFGAALCSMAGNLTLGRKKYAAVEPDIAQAAVLASAFWKVCSRRAEDAAGEQGPGSFRAALMDAAAALTPADFAAEATIELH